MAQPIFEDKTLTKTFFMGLEPGVYLVSGVGGITPFDRDYEGDVVPADQRNTQWAQIREARVDQVTCMVFASREDYQDWRKGWKQNDQGRWVRKDPIQ